MCVMLANLWWATPFYNWDLLAYVGVVESYREDSDELIHANAFDELRETVPAASFSALVGEAGAGDEYRYAVANDPAAFVEQLPFYSVKPLYPVLMSLLNRAGLDLVSSSIWISKVSYFLIGLLLFFWIARYYSSWAALLFSALCMSTPFALDLARYSTPDALSSLMFLSACYLYTESRRPWLAYIVVAVSVTARPDNIIFLVFLTLYDAIVMKERRAVAISATVAGLAAYLLQGAFSGNYGWTVLFHHSFINQFTNPSAANVSFSIVEYMRVLLRQTHPIVVETGSYSLILALFLNAIILMLLYPAWLWSKRFGLVAVSLLSAGAHWLLFPDQKERLFAGWFLFTLVMLLILLQDTVKKARSVSV